MIVDASSSDTPAGKPVSPSINMLRLGKSQNITYYLTPYQEGMKELEDFFQLRYKVFSEGGEANHYGPKANEHDKEPTTFFMLAIEQKEKNGPRQVIGGRRILIHEPGSEYKINAEEGASKTVQQMLPHLVTEDLAYGELGSMCLDEEHRKGGYAKDLYDFTFRTVPFLKLDFLISHAVPSNLLRLQDRAEKAGAKQIVLRRDLRDIDGDETSFISFKPEEELPLLSEEMKASGIGAPATKVDVERIVKNRAPVREQQEEAASVTH